MGDHMPVHLGSMPMSVEAAVAAIDFAPGDVAVLNDPYAGERICRHQDGAAGFLPGAASPGFCVSTRARHADVGGSFLARWGRRENFEEGLRIPRCASCGEGRLTARCWT